MKSYLCMALLLDIFYHAVHLANEDLFFKIDLKYNVFHLAFHQSGKRCLTLPKHKGHDSAAQF